MIELLEKTARECGAILLEERDRGLTATDKDEKLGAHFSTQADDRSQERGIELIRQDLPDEIIVAEEQENEAVIPPNCTLFDPLDGTTALYNGCDEFGVTLCTLRDGWPVAGVIYFPVFDELIRAVRDKGCFINDKQRYIRPIEDTAIDKAMLGTDVGPWTVHDVLEPLSKQFAVRSIMAAIYGARAVLLGQTQGYWNLNIAKIWDAAAGVLAIEEAGGYVCDPWGNPLKWNSITADWVVATNKAWAQKIVQHTSRWPGRQSSE